VKQCTSDLSPSLLSFFFPASCNKSVNMSGSTTKRKQLKLKAVAPKQKLFRANEPLLSVFMWGINHSVSFKCLLYRFSSSTCCVDSFLLLLTRNFILIMCMDVWVCLHVICQIIDISLFSVLIYDIRKEILRRRTACRNMWMAKLYKLLFMSR
jgi:hypothetical protein